MSKQTLSIILAISAVIGTGAFYGGMQYTESKGSGGQFSRGDFQNLSTEERQQRFQELGANVGGANIRQGFGGQAFGGDHESGSGFGGGRFGSGTYGPGSLFGEIISQSDDTLTLKLSDGSTKIVFITSTTQITKSVDGILSDLNEGERVSVSGDENPDGSYTAQSIQLGSFNHSQ